MEMEWRQNGNRMETENVNDSDEGSSEKDLFIVVFMQSMHDDMHKKLTAFLSMLCHCIFKNNFYYDTMQAGPLTMVLLAPKWTFFWILLVHR